MTRILAALLGAAALAGTAHAEPRRFSTPGVVQQIPSPLLYSFTVGKARITALSDGTVGIDLHQILRGATPGEIDAELARGFAANPFEASINAFLIEHEGRRILVDTGVGELFGPGIGGRIPAALALLKVAPDSITEILITHVHTDHSGGLVQGGRMLFPNATVHVGKGDVDLFLDAKRKGEGGYPERYWDEAVKTLKPYADAGKVRTFARPETILAGVTAMPRPGHTPGSAFYSLKSEGQEIVFIGDTIHAAPVQFARPEVTITFDNDQAKARAVRTAALAEFAGSGVLVAAPHISFPGVGHVQAAGRGYRWVPVEFGDRGSGEVLK